MLLLESLYTRGFALSCLVLRGEEEDSSSYLRERGGPGREERGMEEDGRGSSNEPTNERAECADGWLVGLYSQLACS